MIGNHTGDSSQDITELVDINKVENGDTDVSHEEKTIEEPFVGMEFDYEDSAKKFYDEYAKRVGFKMRIDQCRRSEVDKKIISRRLSCNKEGYYTKSKNQFGQIRKQRTSSRQGCNAMMLVRVNKFGKWVVTKFEKEHSHPLVFLACVSLDEGRPQLKCYREHLSTFLKDVEQQTEDQKTVDVTTATPINGITVGQEFAARTWFHHATNTDSSL